MRKRISKTQFKKSFQERRKSASESKSPSHSPRRPEWTGPFATVRGLPAQCPVSILRVRLDARRPRGGLCLACPFFPALFVHPFARWFCGGRHPQPHRLAMLDLQRVRVHRVGFCCFCLPDDRASSGVPVIFVCPAFDLSYSANSVRLS